MELRKRKCENGNVNRKQEMEMRTELWWWEWKRWTLWPFQKHHKFKISFETNPFGSDLKNIPVSETHSGKKGCGIDYTASDDVEKERQKIAIALALYSKDEFRKRIAIGNKALKKGLANCIRGARNHFDPTEPDDDIHEGSWSVIETIQPKEICRWKNKKIFKNEVEKNIAKTVISS